MGLMHSAHRSPRDWLSAKQKDLCYCSPSPETPAMKAPKMPKPQMKKYVVGKTPSTIQNTIGNMINPGQSKNAKTIPKKPSHIFIAPNQKININNPEMMNIVIPIILPIALIRHIASLSIKAS